MINGRSMPDNMDPNYAVQYPRQPYNGNPHMHPGELTLVRVVGHGRWQHPFHEHGNHLRVLARDGNLLLSKTDPTSSPARCCSPPPPRRARRWTRIFYWTGKGLNWDVFGHGLKDGVAVDAQRLHPRRERLLHEQSRGRRTTTNGAAITARRWRRSRSAASPAAAR